ncbi:hypothetical protein POM88_031396 [Heracleum sosnowskyi]|uniref:Bulb-type lectin domain-containing protein n=1 Tax=Heracleum sosnowskyi TaxID=360622 RepID=A0AAD8HY69_9APIA|nr:hypothetical protein POM88_031396 [Heracleum sosnowskyi]
MVPAAKPTSFQLLLFLTFLYFSSDFKISVALDTISSGRSLYLNETLISKGRKFQLGFFSPGQSGNFYVDGSLILFGDFNEKAWTLNTSVASSSVPNKGVLHDDGNFVLSDGRSVIWQSFDNPTDTWLPGGKLGIYGSLTNKVQHLTSWKNRDDSAPGNFSVGINPDRNPELFMWMNRSQIMWRSGAWNGFYFDNYPSLSDGRMYFSHILKSQSNYFTSTNFRYVVTYDGELRQWEGEESSTQWEMLSSYPGDICKRFGLCGPN